MVTKQLARLRVWVASTLVIPTIVVAALGMYRNGSSPASGSNAVLATVNGEKITRRDAALFSSQPVNEFLGMLVDFKLLDQAAAKSRVFVSDKEVADREQNFLKESRAASWESLASRMHRTPDGLAMQIKHAALLEALASKRVTPLPGNMLHCCGILVKIGGSRSRGRAEALRMARFLQEKLDAGASVRELAQKYSDDPPSRGRHGDLGICQGAIPQQLEIHDHKLFLALDAAATTEKLTAPVEGENGYWAIKIVSTLKHPGPDTEAYEPVRQIWKSMWIRRHEPLVMNQLRDRAIIVPPLTRAALP